MTYAPLAAGSDTECVQITNSDPANSTVSLALSGAGATPPTAGAVDVDIDDFSVAKATTAVTCSRNSRGSRDRDDRRD